MTQSARRSGREAENRWAQRVGGKRISEAGMPGADVVDKYGDIWEVKRRGNMTKELWDFVSQARRQGGFRVALYKPRREWLVIMPAKEYYEMMEGFHARQDNHN